MIYVTIRAMQSLLTYLFMKRALDILVSTIMFLAFLIPMVLIGFTIVLTMGFPIFFRHKRPGKDGQLFEIIKFRTMSVPRTIADAASRNDEQRLKKLGKLLRATSIDELPELWNVLKGDMSLVGPRPLLIDYLDRYTLQQTRRHEMRPGITGWAQVNGRNAISWEEKFEMDVWYIDNASFWLDIRILARTLLTVFTIHGISADGHATMPEFTGSPPESEIR